jgi:regulator of sigma E protease
MQILLTFFVIILIFGLLVFVHEFGHFIAAKKSGVIVEEFAFGFGPKLFSKKWRGTLYRINSIPLGGYVKMAGDQDGSSFLRYTAAELSDNVRKFALKHLKDNGLDPKKSSYEDILNYVRNAEGNISEADYLKLSNYIAKEYIPKHPGNYGNAAFWNKVVILIAGVVMNFVLGAILFYTLFFINGFEVYVPQIGNPNLIGGNVRNEFPIVYRFYEEDLDENIAPALIVGVEGIEFENEEDFISILNENYDNELSLNLFSFADNKNHNITTVLNGEGINSSLDEDIINKIVISEVAEDSAAAEASLEAGHVILSLDNQEIATAEELIEIRDANRGQEIEIEVVNNNGQIETVNILIPDPEEGEPLIGTRFGLFDYEFFRGVTMIDYGSDKYFSGFAHAYNMIAINASGLSNLVGQSFEQRSIEPVSQGVGSIIAITDITYTLVGFGDFTNLLNLTAMLSVILAFMNILPIPLLDGGHLVFLVIEKVRGRPLPPSIEEKIGKYSFIFLIVLTLLIMFKDVVQFDWPGRIYNLILGVKS